MNNKLDVNHIIETIKRDGIVIIPNYLNLYDIGKIVDESDKIFSNMKHGQTFYSEDNIEGNDYFTGKAARIQKEDYNKYIPCTSSLFIENENFNQIIKEHYGESNLSWLQIFFTYEYELASNYSEYVRSGNLHVDLYQALKFIFYLTDCTKESGAFRYHLGTHNIGRKYREGGGLMIKDNQNLWKKYNDSNCEWAEGEAGTLLIFNTDTLHGGGLIEREGLYRRTVIAHNRR